MAAAPIALAAELLDVVKSIHESAGGKGGHEAYEAKQRARQLLETLTRDILGPHEYTISIAESCHESAALRLVTECGVADAIGDGAKSAAEISADVGVGLRHLDIALRCVNALGYFEQVGEFGSAVFKNNEMSSILRSGHPQTLKEAVEFICDDGFKSAAYFVEAARAAAQPGDAPTLAANLAFGFTGSVFRRWSEPEHAWRGKRMGQAMKQLHHVANRNVITDFDWRGLALPIVDVGGGIGTLEMMLAREYPLSEFSFVLFDLQGTIANAKEAWKPLLSATRAQIDFVAGSFLSSDPDTTGIPPAQPTYLIRHVLHDWTDEEVLTILRNVRAAMIASPPSSARARDISAAVMTPPKLLLCEMLLQEDSSIFAYTTSVQVLALNNGIVRTESDMVSLLARAGFGDVKKHALRAADCILEAIPLASA